LSSTRIFTCTPVRFKGDHTFFSRDSGLLSVGLRMRGVESQAVMPGPKMQDDDPDLIRAECTQLENADWWRSQALDAVVFFSWAMPPYTRIAEAIKASGAKLVVFLDSAGFWNPLSNGTQWFKAQWDSSTRKHGMLFGSGRFMMALARSFIPQAFDLPRLRHMDLADIVTVTSPLVLTRTRNYARRFGFSRLAKRIHLLPLPVNPCMRYLGQQKRKRVICIGRWLPEDWPEKCPRMLAESLDNFLLQRLDYEAFIVGRGAKDLLGAHFYPQGPQSLRIHLIDYLPNTDLPALLAESQISICSSFHESFHIASFEAACCGCSIVALNSPDLPALQYLAQTSGTLAAEETSEAFAAALCREAELWDRSARNPFAISERWESETHSHNVAKHLIQLLGL
jgi:glycosyltransferase involved in cell wall biosynthesis